MNKAIPKKLKMKQQMTIRVLNYVKGIIFMVCAIIYSVQAAQLGNRNELLPQNNYEKSRTVVSYILMVRIIKPGDECEAGRERGNVNTNRGYGLTICGPRDICTDSKFL